MKTPTFRRWVLHHPEMGVFLGSCMGLGFWSELDPAGQTYAVAFESPGQALEFTETWEHLPDGVRSVEIRTLWPDKASVGECVGAGLPGWEPKGEGRR